MLALYRISVIFFLLCLSGCGSLIYHSRVDYGYGSQFAIAKPLNDFVTGINIKGEPRGDLPMDGHYTAVKIGARVAIMDALLDIDIGPAIFVPTKGPDNNLYTAELSFKLMPSTHYVRPYIEPFAGVGRSDHRWDGEGTKLLFTVGGSIGASLILSPQWELDVGYRFYHASNGALIFGTKKPNVGYNTDIVLLGVKGRF